MGMECIKCGQIGEEHIFATFRVKDGNIKRRKICKNCRGQYALDNFERLKEYRKNYNVQNRTKKQERDFQLRADSKAFTDKIKSETPCADCGNHFHPVAMDFDHIGPKTKGVSNMVSQGYKIELIAEEIKQCEIVCACCHRIRTHNRKENLHPPKILSYDNYTIY